MCLISTIKKLNEIVLPITTNYQSIFTPQFQRENPTLFTNNQRTTDIVRCYMFYFTNKQNNLLCRNLLLLLPPLPPPTTTTTLTTTSSTQHHRSINHHLPQPTPTTFGIIILVIPFTTSFAKSISQCVT